jgi:hypothetical protein
MMAAACTSVVEVVEKENIKKETSALILLMSSVDVSMFI